MWRGRCRSCARTIAAPSIRRPWTAALLVEVSFVPSNRAASLVPIETASVGDRLTNGAAGGVADGVVDGAADGVVDLLVGVLAFALATVWLLEASVKVHAAWVAAARDAEVQIFASAARSCSRPVPQGCAGVQALRIYLAASREPHRILTLTAPQMRVSRSTSSRAIRIGAHVRCSRLVAPCIEIYSSHAVGNALRRGPARRLPWQCPRLQSDVSYPFRLARRTLSGVPERGGSARPGSRGTVRSLRPNNGRATMVRPAFAPALNAAHVFSSDGAAAPSCSFALATSFHPNDRALGDQPPTPVSSMHRRCRTPTVTMVASSSSAKPSTGGPQAPARRRRRSPQPLNYSTVQTEESELIGTFPQSVGEDEFEPASVVSADSIMPDGTEASRASNGHAQKRAAEATRLASRDVAVAANGKTRGTATRKPRTRKAANTPRPKKPSFSSSSQSRNYDLIGSSASSPGLRTFGSGRFPVSHSDIVHQASEATEQALVDGHDRISVSVAKVSALMDRALYSQKTDDNRALSFDDNATLELTPRQTHFSSTHRRSTRGSFDRLDNEFSSATSSSTWAAAESRFLADNVLMANSIAHRIVESVISGAAAMGISRVTRRSRVILYYNTKEDAEWARNQAPLAWGDRVLHVPMSQRVKRVSSDVSVLVAPSNRRRVSSIEMVERVHYSDWSSSNIVILLCPDLYAVTNYPELDGRCRRPCFLSDYIESFVLDPAVFHSDRGTGALLKQYPRKWEMYLQKASRGTEFRLVGERAKRPPPESMYHTFASRLEGSHA